MDPASQILMSEKSASRHKNKEDIHYRLAQEDKDGNIINGLGKPEAVPLLVH